MRRKIGMLLAAVLVAATLAACGDGASGSASSSAAQSGSAASSASAETVTLKLATKMSEDSTEGIAFQHFADLVNEYTNGEVFVQVYPNEQLGNSSTTVTNLQLGTVDLYAEGSTHYSGYTDKFSWVTIPFLTGSWENYETIVQGDYGKQQESDLEAAGFKVISTNRNWQRGPYYVMCSTMPLNTADDLSGLRMRTVDSATYMSGMSNLGINPLVISYSETYLAIQQGTVSAVSCPISNVKSMAFFEVAPYITKMDTYPNEILMVMNNDKFYSLTESQQEALVKAANDAADYSNELLQTAVDEDLAFLKKDGATINMDFDVAPLREKLTDYYQGYINDGTIPGEVAEILGLN